MDNFMNMVVKWHEKKEIEFLIVERKVLLDESDYGNTWWRDNCSQWKCWTTEWDVV